MQSVWRDRRARRIRGPHNQVRKVLPAVSKSPVRVVAEGSCVAVRGNQFCFREEWDSAVVAYSEALQARAKVGGNLQLTSTILSNRSAACARLGQWKQSLQDAEQVVPALLEER